MANEIDAQGFTGARVGFAKIPPPSINATTKSDMEDVDYYSNQAAIAPASSASTTPNAANSQTATDQGSNLMQDATVAWQNDLFNIMCQFNINDSTARNFVKGKEI